MHSLCDAYAFRRLTDPVRRNLPVDRSCTTVASNQAPPGAASKTTRYVCSVPHADIARPAYETARMLSWAQRGRPPRPCCRSYWRSASLLCFSTNRTTLSTMASRPLCARNGVHVHQCASMAASAHERFTGIGSNSDWHCGQLTARNSIGGVRVNGTEDGGAVSGVSTRDDSGVVTSSPSTVRTSAIRNTWRSVTCRSYGVVSRLRFARNAASTCGWARRNHGGSHTNMNGSRSSSQPVRKWRTGPKRMP